MIALLFLAALQTAPTGDEVVVIARKLQAVKVAIGRTPAGKFTCALSASSGNARLDDRLCKSAASCARKVGPDAEAVKSCVTSSKPKLLAQLRDEFGRDPSR